MASGGALKGCSVCNDKKLGDPDHFGSILDTREWGIVHRQQEMSLQELQMALEKYLAKQKPMSPEFSTTVDKHFWELV